MFETGRAARRNHPPLGPGQFGQSSAHALGQFIVLDKVARCFLDGRLHRRQFHRAANDRKGPPAVDDRLDADGAEDALLLRWRLVADSLQIGQDG
jgi:hypothetical protein